jgi:four helix bundle protein
VTSGQFIDFRQQLLWQKAQAFAVELTRLVRDLPRDASTAVIGGQLLRSGGSIAANIAEGYGRFSTGAYRNHLSIARGSAFESKSWLDLLVQSGYLAPDARERLISSCIEIEKLLTYRMKAIPNSNGYKIKEEEATYEA